VDQESVSGSGDQQFVKRKILAVAAVLAFASLLPRQLVLLAGAWQAEAVVRDAGDDDEQRILSASRWVAHHYTGRDSTPAYYNLIHFLTDSRLPELVRLPTGAVEAFTLSGECDSASRALSFLLDRLGYDSDQINLATLNSAHSALLVQVGDRNAYVDPYYGIAAYADGRLQSVRYLIAEAEKLAPIEDATLPLRDNPDIDYYRTWQSMPVFKAIQGWDIGIVINLPRSNGKMLQFGHADEDTRDLAQSLNSNRLTPYLTYVGNQYDRAWTRTLVASENVRVSFLLTEDVDPELIQSSLPPKIEGRRISWELKAGQKLVLYNDKTPLRIFGEDAQAIDAIRLTPLKG
jgi:hypothetical protein